MVASRLYEVTTKGTEWAYSRSSGSGYDTPSSSPSSPSMSRSLSLSPPPSPVAPPLSSVASHYLKFANYSIQTAAASTYSTLSYLASSFSIYYGSNGENGNNGNQQVQEGYGGGLMRSPSNNSDLSTSLRSASRHSQFTMTPKLPLTLLQAADLAPMLFQNPYHRSYSYTQPPASMSAVRALLTHTVVEEGRIRLPTMDVDDDDENSLLHPTPIKTTQTTTTTTTSLRRRDLSHPKFDHITSTTDTDTDRATTAAEGDDNSSVLFKWSQQRQQQQGGAGTGVGTGTGGVGGGLFLTVPPSETAAQIAEGTIRALRDFFCDEAVELQIALRFWTERWEHPLLSWMEAGPQVWMSPEGYNHQNVGKKVAQIQAVLARRCATIGELQQHLLRAGWQRGVAQWGVLGHGGEWAAIAGCDGTIADEVIAHSYARREARRKMERNTDNGPNLESNSPNQKAMSSSTPSSSSSPTRDRVFQHVRDSQASAANILVQRRKGGGELFVDDPAFLTEWTVEAIALVRRVLRAASAGKVPIPHEEIWYPRRSVTTTAATTDSNNNLQDEESVDLLPAWAGDSSRPLATDNVVIAADSSDHYSTLFSFENHHQGLVVANLPLLVEEVSDLLNVMEDIMTLQRRRRLDVLRPPTWLRRSWYIVMTLTPPISYILYKATRRETISFVVQKIRDFFRERLREPLVAIFNELWKGRESFSDREARMEAMESLKKMIKSWLDDTFPQMPEMKRIELSDAMDVTLIEQQKVESMKTFFEINNVIRMSFIEMQYMKKELLNALSAIDEMMSANDINMNMAAITPVAMLVYVQIRVFRFLYYALLKLGKSRQETYDSFRSILTDIERLLVMRDNPPAFYSNPQTRAEDPQKSNASQELRVDDLGMIMLLIHECRRILWRDRRRFSTETIRSVNEDLAELAGERGAVSVRQQLQIIERMSRTYRFLQIKRE